MDPNELYKKRMSAYQREYYLAHKEERKEYMKKRYQEKKEQIKARSLERYYKTRKLKGE